jgi:hypothetical protein
LAKFKVTVTAQTAKYFPCNGIEFSGRGHKSRTYSAHKKDSHKMQHENWIWEPSQGGQVAEKTLALKPVDPIAYKMKDIWGYDQDQFPIEPFDIEVRITASTVREGLHLFEQAVKEYMLEHFEGYTRHQYVERLDWSDEFSELKSCEIIMST